MGKFGKMRLKIKLANLKTIVWSEKNEVGKNSRKIIISMPNLSIPARASAYSVGKTATITRPPSKGGIGIRLKIAKTIFKRQALLKSLRRSGLGKKLNNNLAIMAKKIAKIKLDAGPAKPTKPISFFMFLRL